jgi:hypothetical protein
MNCRTHARALGSPFRNNSGRVPYEELRAGYRKGCLRLREGPRRWNGFVRFFLIQSDRASIANHFV